MIISLYFLVDCFSIEFCDMLLLLYYFWVSHVQYLDFGNKCFVFPMCTCMTDVLFGPFYKVLDPLYQTFVLMNIYRRRQACHF